MMKASDGESQPIVAGWLRSRWRGILPLQLCYYAVIALVMVIFAANYPANLPDWRFFSVEIALALLLILNFIGVGTKPGLPSKTQARLEWGFLVLSALLIFGTVWLSSQRDVIYLLSVVCIQASYKKGVWPAGVVFGVAMIVAWFVYQMTLGLPIWEIVGKESALVVGIAFGLVAVTLLHRARQQTERAETLLLKLQTANRELEAAQLKEKELAVAEERIRLARELHDSVTQSLYSMTLYAEAAAELIDTGESGDARGHLRELRDTAQQALQEMRLLIFELRRPALEKNGLAAALQARLDAVEGRGGIQAELLVEGKENLPPDVQAELYAIAQEALNNAIRHAKARCVQIRLRFDGCAAGVEILDDGVGFDVANDQAAGGFGLAGMKERARKIDGTLLIDSAPGKGTRIAIWTPVVPGERRDPAQTTAVKEQAD
jgi:signal transduction histidine kinase